MERPASIVTFERCYLGAWVVGLINSALNWNVAMAAMADNPSVAQLGPSFASTMMIGGLAIGAAITLLLWYFVARRGSVVAKWIVTVFFALGLASFLWSLAAGRGFGLVTVIALVAMALQAIAVAMLFRPDTKPWFGETVDEPLADNPWEPRA